MRAKTRSQARPHAEGCFLFPFALIVGPLRLFSPARRLAGNYLPEKDDGRVGFCVGFLGFGAFEIEKGGHFLEIAKSN